MAVQELAALEWVTRQPLRLAPNRVYRVWKGGALLDRLQGNPGPEDIHFPEEWVGSTTVSRLPGRPPDEGLSRVRLRDDSTVVLKSLIEAFPAAMLGKAHVARHGKELGVLCKLLDSAMRLPVQCHPDRAFAREYLRSDFGKTEAWLILGTRAVDEVPPYLLFGFRDGVTEEAFRRMVQRQDIPAQAVGMAYVRQHTLAPRLLQADIQGREEALIGPEDTPCFGAARLTVRGTVSDRDRGRCYIGIVTEGRGHIIGPDCDVALRPGTTLFIPAASRHHAYRAGPDASLTLIKCFPPPGEAG